MRFSNFSVMMLVIGAATAAPPATRQLRGSINNNSHNDYDENYKEGGVLYEDNFNEDYELDDLDKEIAFEDYEENTEIAIEDYEDEESDDEEEMVTRSSVFKGYDEEMNEEVIFNSNEYDEESDKEDHELHNNSEDYDESDDDEESKSSNFMTKSAFHGAGAMTNARDPNEEDMMNSYNPNNEDMMNSYDEEILINSEKLVFLDEDGKKIMSKSVTEKSNYDSSEDLEYFSIDEDDDKEEKGINFRSSSQNDNDIDEQNRPKLNIDDEETMMMARSDRDSYDEVSEEDFELQNNNNYGESNFFDDLDKEIADEDYEYNKDDEEEDEAYVNLLRENDWEGYDNVEEDYELHNDNSEEEEAYDESDEEENMISSQFRNKSQGEIEQNLKSAFHGVGAKTNHYLNIKEEEESLLRENDFEESVEYKEREMKINALKKEAEEKKNDIKEELNVKINALKEEEMEEIKNIEMDAFNEKENIMKMKAAANNAEEEERIYYHD